MARYSKAFRQKEEATVSVARVYADINEKRPPEYWDYEALNVQVRVCGVQAAGDEGAQKNNSRHQGGAGMHTHSHTRAPPSYTKVERPGPLRGRAQGGTRQVQRGL